MQITIKRQSQKKTSGFEVTQNKNDGHYYISKVPKYFNNGIQIGDRVLNINGTHFLDFQNEQNANDLIETFQLELVPAGDDEEEEEDEEEDDDVDISDDDDDDEDESAEVPRNGNNGGSRARGGDGSNDDDDEAKNWSDSEEEEEEDDEEEEEEEWTRPTQRYQPMDRFMVTVTKGEDPYNPGIELAAYKGEYYVVGVDQNGPFYTTSIDKGDKIVSLNGKKSKDIASVEYAMELIDSKQKTTVFVMRPDPNMDKGYKWVMSKH